MFYFLWGFRSYTLILPFHLFPNLPCPRLRHRFNYQPLTQAVARINLLAVEGHFGSEDRA